MPATSTPSFYVEETPRGRPRVSEPESTVPAFIGYTEKAMQSTAHDLLLVPTPVRSLVEFTRLFGGPHPAPISVTVSRTPQAGFVVDAVGGPVITYLLWHAVSLFFMNGGARCLVTSVGIHQATPHISLSGDGSNHLPTAHGLLDGLAAAASSDAPNLVVVPEAIRLPPAEFSTLAQAILAHCAARRDRLAILDVQDGEAPLTPSALASNRERFGLQHLGHGAAFYPFVRTSFAPHVAPDGSNVRVTMDGVTETLGALAPLGSRPVPTVHQLVTTALARLQLALPPSGAVAGAVASQDARAGVWHAPANLALAGVTAPAVALTEPEMATLSIDPSHGRSINALRLLPSRGTVIWGARTLDGNHGPRRYIPVRRLLMLVEQSIQRSAAWVAFEPNAPITWARVRSMIEDYLHAKWRVGALMGSTPQEAYFVQCGLGTTMTDQDVGHGRLVAVAGIAPLRAAEFEIIRVSLTTDVP